MYLAKYMKEFDYEKGIASGRSKEVLEFYLSVRDKKISLAYFIVAMKRFPKKSPKSTSRQLRHLKREYNNLKNVFGFFKG